MKRVLFYFSLLLLISSCKKDNNLSNKVNEYVLSIEIDNKNGHFAYIQKLNNPKEKDSVLIQNSIGILKGEISTPERYILTIGETFGGKMFVLANDSINIKVPEQDLLNAQISGSKINEELKTFQKKSEEIYDKIDLLFPDLQRARLENNADYISEIAKKMSAIEEENISFNYNYASEHPNSFISAMILNDLSKRDSIDVKKVVDLYNLLSEDVKKSSDAQFVHNYIQQLH